MLRLILIILVSFVCRQAVAQFIEVSAQNGINLYNDNPLFGNGSCFVDFDDDGWDDISLVAKNQQCRFYKNNQGEMDEYYPNLNPALPTNIDGKCILWLDYDNDGDKDMIYTGLWTPLRLYENDGNMNFTDVAEEAGLVSEPVQIYGVSAGEINNDGCLDLFVCKYHNHTLYNGYQYANHVYQSNCDGTFTDVTLSCGIGEQIQATFCCVWLDYNMDGWQDIYVINDRYSYPNFLYTNNGDGTFTDNTADSGAGIYIEAMSATCDDYDNDGDMDIFVSNTFEGNYLLNYDKPNNHFNNVSQVAGVEVFRICWGGLWIDYDNNTWQDLFVSTINNVGTLEWPNYFYINNEDGTFTEGMETVGIEDDNDATHCVAMGDMNKDGYFDYATNNSMPSNASLWQNDGGENNWLAVTLEGTISNKDAFGTWIEMYLGDDKYIRYTFGGENFMGQNSEAEIFGMADAYVVDSLKLKWLSGLVETYYLPTPNQYHHYIEGQSFANQPIEITADGPLIFCEGGSVTLAAPPAESYQWSTGDTAQTILAYVPGFYSVVVINNFGFEQNSNTLEVALAENVVPIITSNNITCNGLNNGQISVTLEWSEISEINWSNGDDDTLLENLAPGLYEFALTDNHNCQAADSITIVEPDSLEIAVSVSDVTCYLEDNGIATLEITGGTGPEYFTDWNGLNPDALPAGNFTVVVHDMMNCAAEAQFQVTQPNAISVQLTSTPQYENGEMGSATIEISGGTAPYDVLWSNTEQDVFTIENLAAGFYSVLVTDTNGCDVSNSFEIDFIPLSINEIANIEFQISPNPAGDKILIKTTQPLGMCSVIVSNLNGSVAMRTETNFYSSETLLDIEKLAAGEYFIVISNSKQNLGTVKFEKY